MKWLAGEAHKGEIPRIAEAGVFCRYIHIAASYAAD
jgi:hypothetical protein